MTVTRKRFSAVEEELVRRHYADSHNADLAVACRCTVEQLYRLANRLGVSKSPAYISATFGPMLAAAGMAARFKPGAVPANKGKKMPEGWAPGDMARTQFKPGQVPSNWMPVGSYRLSSQGSRKGARKILEYKFSDAPGPHTNRWIPVHRKVWIEANGPVPPGHVVAWKPGRYSTRLEDITLDALECITNADNVRRNSIHQLPPELADVHRLRGVLTRAINRKQKEKDHE